VRLNDKTEALPTVFAVCVLANFELIDEIGFDGAPHPYAVRDGRAQYLGSIKATHAYSAQIAAHQ
jgi:hypothetical protein